MFGKWITLLKGVCAHVKATFSEHDGTGSASRTIGLIVAGSSMGVLVGYFVAHHDLPSADQLYGLSALIAAGSGAYLGNKFGKDHPEDHSGE